MASTFEGFVKYGFRDELATPKKVGQRIKILLLDFLLDFSLEYFGKGQLECP